MVLGLLGMLAGATPKFETKCEQSSLVLYSRADEVHGCHL